MFTPPRERDTPPQPVRTRTVASSAPAGFGHDPEFGELFGRLSEQALVHGLLSNPRGQLITLTGPAGVGKSHLAHTAFHTWPRRRAADTLWMDLASADGALALWSRLDARTAKEAAERIGGAEVLLVLDNCDLVGADIAMDVSALLRACPRLRILVTSRMPLDLRAEHVLPVDPLPTGPGSPAEDIFITRVHPSYRARLAQEPGRLVVADICREVDGVPLAVEMAAEAVGAESPHAVLDRLRRGEYTRRRRRLRDAPDRHRGGDSALAWAACVLSDTDRQLLGRIAVFESAVSLSAVRHMARAGHEAAVSGVESLVHKSLLLSGTDQDGEPEFRLTHMARHHYREELARDDAAFQQALDLHAGHCAVFAADIAKELRRGRHPSQLLSAVGSRLPDLRKAAGHLSARGDHAGVLRLLTSLEGPLLDHGLAPEVADVIEESTAALPPADPAGTLAAEALMSVARWALDRDDQQRAQAALDRAAAACADSPGGHARVTGLTGELLRRRGETAAAAVLLDSAIPQLDAVDDVRAGALARRSLALVRAAHGDPDAEQPVLEALDALSRTPDGADPAWRSSESPIALRASLLSALARIRRLQGRAVEAYETVRASMRLLLRTGSPAQAAEALETVAVLAFRGGAEEQRYAVARVLAYAAALRGRYGLVSDDDGTLRALTDRLHGSVEAPTLRQLRADARHVSVRDALIAGLFAPPPDKEPAARAGSGAPLGLTPRQHEVALLVAEGLTNRQVGRRLGISEWTVTNHLRVVMQKLECTSRVHVARIVQRAGL
ncbi:LuxR C-terminal-related transcriptional regulator [Streptomyces sp. NPDC058092]|uniref:LuxR C-terminal-related transcriptional regulator n=1 Tax=Streptomyces sp. NPDC058092 TaxID=3346336 RepID=UPI0036E9426F